MGARCQAIADSIRRINRICPITLASQPKGYKVAISHGFTMLTHDKLQNLLEQEKALSFVLGDSTGLSSDIINMCDETCSISALPIHHKFEACILLDEIEKTLQSGGR